MYTMGRVGYNKATQPINVLLLVRQGSDCQCYGRMLLAPNDQWAEMIAPFRKLQFPTVRL